MTIYFKRTKIVSGFYPSFSRIKLGRAKDDDISPVSLILQEYNVVAGDISVDHKTWLKKLAKYRRELREAGHRTVIE